MRLTRRLLLTAIAAAVAFAASAGPVWSQVPTPGAEEVDDPSTVVHSWALTPAGSGDPASPGNRPHLTYEIAPGAQVKDAVTLFNYGNVQLTFRLYATDAFNNDDGEFDLLPGDEQPTDAGSWVTVQQQQLTVPPKSQATVPITITVPDSARPGDHAGAVLASNAATGTGPDGKTVTFDRRTGTRMYVRVSGPLAPSLEVAGVTASYAPSLDPMHGTVEVTYRIENRGNVRIGGHRKVSVGGPLGIGRKQTKTLPIPELLPGEHVTLHARFARLPALGVAVAKVDLDPHVIGTDEVRAAPQHRRALTLAPPVTVLALAAIAWLLAIARRSYLRRRGLTIQPS